MNARAVQRKTFNYKKKKKKRNSRTTFTGKTELLVLLPDVQCKWLKCTLSFNWTRDHELTNSCARCEGKNPAVTWQSEKRNRFYGENPYHWQRPRMFLVNGWTLHPSATGKAFSSIYNHFWTTHIKWLCFATYNVRTFCQGFLSYQCEYFLIPKDNSENKTKQWRYMLALRT